MNEENTASFEPIALDARTMRRGSGDSSPEPVRGSSYQVKYPAHRRSNATNRRRIVRVPLVLSSGVCGHEILGVWLTT